ncbi:MAG: hypothetical protein UF228_06765 [Lachnospiraceae bacterium]|nr:hypothetical protein [Lachnospiraceae bacterium]
MNMVKTVTGYCPTQNKDYSIYVTYVDMSTLSGKCYERGTADCPYNRSGNRCKLEKCPILNSAPEEL